MSATATTATTLVKKTLGWSIFLSVLMIVAGLLAITIPLIAGIAVTIFVGWLFVDGIVTLILAVLIWRTWPSSTEWVLGTLVGISMLFSGITRLMISLAARRLVSALA